MNVRLNYIKYSYFKISHRNTLFVRILGLMVVGPFFKSPSIITQVKVYLSAIIAVILTSAFWSEQPIIDFHPWYLALLVIKSFSWV